MGYVYKRIIVDNENWQPIYPMSREIKTVSIDNETYYKTIVKFHVEISPLIIDTEAIHGTQTSQ